MSNVDPESRNSLPSFDQAAQDEIYRILQEKVGAILEGLRKSNKRVPYLEDDVWVLTALASTVNESLFPPTQNENTNTPVAEPKDPSD